MCIRDRIFASTAEGDLYVLNEEDPSEATYVTNLGVILTDMAYNSETGILYGVTDNQLVTVDKLLGTVETVGEIGITTNTLACDNEGNFYCVAYGDTNEVTNRGFVYRFTLDTICLLYTSPLWTLGKTRRPCPTAPACSVSRQT